MQTYTALLCLTALFSSHASAQDREADKAALRSLAARYETAINTGKITDLKESFLPSATAVFITGRECKGVDEMQQYYHDVREKIGSASTYTVKLTPDATEFFGDMALAHGNCDETLTSGKGDPVTWQSKWTAVLQKADGQWRTARLHASMDPIDNPLAAMKAGATKWTFAAGGLITGSLLMAIFLRWKTKA